MNIVQVSGGEVRIPQEKGGGAQEFILAVSRCLSQMGHNVAILDRKYSNEEPDIEDIDGVKIVRLRAVKFNLSVFAKLPKLAGFFSRIEEFLNYLAFSFSVRRYVSGKKDTDVIHSHFSVVALGLTVLSRHLGAKCIYSCHSALRSAGKLNLWERIRLIPENLAVRRVKRVIVDNELTKEKLVQAANIKPEKVKILPFGVDTSVFNPAVDTADIKCKYGLDRGSVVLFVGRIAEHKGVEYLIRAANIVVNELGHKYVQFVLVGPTTFRQGTEDTRYLAMILKLIEGYGLQGNVRLTGVIPRDDLIKLYGVSDVFVLPSIAEMAPAVMREAMACARPVIGTRVGNIPELVKDGLNGFVVEPADEKELAEKIIYLVDNPAQAKMMGEKGRKIIEERSWEKTAEKLLLVYEEIKAT